jgi:hypothetical protein
MLEQTAQASHAHINGLIIALIDLRSLTHDNRQVFRQGLLLNRRRVRVGYFLPKRRAATLRCMQTVALENVLDLLAPMRKALEIKHVTREGAVHSPGVLQ